MTADIQESLESVEHELSRLKNNNFTGNIEMKFNIKNGTVININCGLHRVIFITRKDD